jgi:hypothetical protein
LVLAMPWINEYDRTDAGEHTFDVVAHDITRTLEQLLEQVTPLHKQPPTTQLQTTPVTQPALPSTN